jgi:hypothetical protein
MKQRPNRGAYNDLVHSLGLAPMTGDSYSLVDIRSAAFGNNPANGTLLGSELFCDFLDLFPSTQKLQISARDGVAGQNVRSKPPGGDGCRSAMLVSSLIEQVSKVVARTVKSAITTSKNGKKQPTSLSQ